MVFPRALQAMSHFTFRDLTRVRSGPTCVRQLVDWGAKVIKIDALLEDGAGERPGGARQGSAFQNLHLNKRAMTLDLNDPKGFEVSCASRQRPTRSSITSDFFDRRQTPHLGRAR
jgi:crotonobetainyl-CoA:carnitine CoA-transferase CaiB-like acyl-CoA transferase